ncbi:MAG: hypothetical protein J0J01_29960 [Reyranella sp.]|uniref:hypothetical protein n=1 Tax=Reyranella sp. TaxID=1929291 RepID=UPI001AC94BAC|nr:hypothetical protein [Reyranella sp.]MBN9091163.1 hypothetical protein [Reyranella sp.]
MTVMSEALAEGEPPSPPLVADARCAALVERVWAVAHLRPSAHVAIIGRRTLPLVLEFLKRGCSAVRSLHPGAPAPDCEAAQLAWIVDVGDGELDDALRAARARAGNNGRVIVEGAATLPRVRDRAVAQGLDVVSFDHVASRVVLATVHRPAMAA